MYDIYVNGTLVYIGRDQKESELKALAISDQNPYAEVVLLTWDDVELFHTYPIE